MSISITTYLLYLAIGSTLSFLIGGIIGHFYWKNATILGTGYKWPPPNVDPKEWDSSAVESHFDMIARQQREKRMDSTDSTTDSTSSTATKE